MVCQIDLDSMSAVEDGVLAPGFVPFLRLEGSWEGSAHLHCLTDWQEGRCLLVEHSQDFVVEINGSAGKLYRSEDVVLKHIDSGN